MTRGGLISALSWFALGVALCTAAFLWDDGGGSAFATEPGFWWKLGDVALLYAAVPQTLFVVAYSRSPWFRQAIGRALMLKGAALAILLDWAFVYRVVGIDFLAADQVRAAAFCLIAAGTTYQFVVVTHIQWRARGKDGGDDGHGHGNPFAPRNGEHAPTPRRHAPSASVVEVEVVDLDRDPQ